MKVKLDIFEGPLDLLLHLIKKEEINIYDIPIAHITAQYLEYIKIMKMLNLDGIGEFLVMAATLIYIKSKMLLPQEESVFEAEEEDPRAELVSQLLEYKRYKKVASQLAQREKAEQNYYIRVVRQETAPARLKEPFLEVSLFSLLTAFKQVFAYVKEEKPYTGISYEKITVSEKMKEILKKFRFQQKINFTDIFIKPCLSADRVLTKQEVIVTFLALLELIRLNRISVQQRRLFSEIQIVAVAFV